MMKNYSKISLFFFLFIAIIGTLIRAFPFLEIPLEYKHLLHSHSHVAFQGWIYTLIILFTTHLFLTPAQLKKGRYVIQFKITIWVVLGILVSFSLQGYGAYSIILSSLFQVLYYVFVFQFFKDVRKQSVTPALRFIKAGLLLGVLSTLAPWGIGVLSAKGLAHTEIYEAVLYFFLHFQYNGLFLFIIIGVLFKWLENSVIPYKNRQAHMLYNVSIVTVFLSYFLSLLGMSFKDSIIVFAVLASILQWVELVLLGVVFVPIWTKMISKQNFVLRLILSTVWFCFALKVLLQSLSVFPCLQEYAFSNRFIVMAYMHLNFIGIISFAFLAFLFHWKWLRFNSLSKIGCTTLFSGFIGSELMLIAMGMHVYHSNMLLLFFSSLMVFGISFLLLSYLSKDKD